MHKTYFLKMSGDIQHTYYKKLKRVLDAQKVFSEYTKIYFIGGFEYTDKTYSRFKEQIENGTLKEFFDEVRYNAQRDNVEVYLIENDDSTYLLSLLDPLELLSAERVLDIIKSPEIKIENINHELVYPT